MNTLWLPIHVFCAIMLIGLGFGAFFQTCLDRRTHLPGAPAIMLSGLLMAAPCFAILIFTGFHIASLMHLPITLPWITSALTAGTIAVIAFFLGLTCTLWQLWRGTGRMGAMALYATSTIGFSMAVLHMLGKTG